MVIIFFFLRNFISLIFWVGIFKKRVVVRLVLFEFFRRARGFFCVIILLFLIFMLFMGKMKWGDLICIFSFFLICYKTVCQYITLLWNMEVFVIRVQVRVFGLRILMEIFLCICQILKVWILYFFMFLVFRFRFSRFEF